MKAFVTQCKECLWAAIFVVILLVCTAASWWLVLVGTNPFHSVSTAQLYDLNGDAQTQFKRGDWVYVKRFMCVDHNILSIQSHALYDIVRHSALPLAFSSAVVQEGCSVRGYMFQIPGSLPPGVYEYRSTARFQDNLIGRDQSNTFLSVVLRVQ